MDGPLSEADWSQGPQEVRPSLLRNLGSAIGSNQCDYIDAAGYHARCEGLERILKPFMENSRVTTLKLNRESLSPPFSSKNTNRCDDFFCFLQTFPFKILIFDS